MTYTVSVMLHQEFPTLGQAVALLATIKEAGFDGYDVESASLYREDEAAPLIVSTPTPPEAAAPATPAPAPRRARKGDAAVQVDPSPVIAPVDDPSHGADPATSNPPAPQASTAPNATAASAPVPASPSTAEPAPPADPDETRVLMRKCLDAGKRAQVKAAMDKHGGGASSVTSMTVGARAEFFAALKGIANG